MGVKFTFRHRIGTGQGVTDCSIKLVKCNIIFVVVSRCHAEQDGMRQDIFIFLLWSGNGTGQHFCLWEWDGTGNSLSCPPLQYFESQFMSSVLPLPLPFHTRVGFIGNWCECDYKCSSVINR